MIPRHVRVTIDPSRPRLTASATILSTFASIFASRADSGNSVSPATRTSGLRSRETSCVRSFAFAAAALRPPTSTAPTLTPLAIVSLRLES